MPRSNISKSKKAKTVRLGIVGIGNMGGGHSTWILQGLVPGCELAAVCDLNPQKLERFKDIPHFTDAGEMIRSGEINAILIATPHYDHTTIGIQALKAGLHVMVEKPLSVHKADCERLIAAYQNKKQVFAAMFNQRTDPVFQKIRSLIRNGELGRINRINWIITNWFRTGAYYASGGWRATWAGEGGGVLLNQCPHNLDLYQWLFGMPDQVRGFCKLGHRHDIEVEDEVTAYFEYKSGATAVFITSTGEAPGTNRLEITGERGRLVTEGGKITFLRNEIETTEFSRTTKESFNRPETWQVEIPVGSNPEPQHVYVLRNFTNAILHGEKLIAPAVEGIHSVELGNSILMSSLLGETVAVPLSGAKYEKMLKKLIAGSRFKKKVVKPTAAASDFSKSFGK